jgi:hypothetical protein
LAARNACTRAGDRAERKRFKLARDVRGFEVELGRKLDTPDLVLYEADECNRYARTRACGSGI